VFGVEFREAGAGDVTDTASILRGQGISTVDVSPPRAPLLLDVPPG
jgi:hypothetical protein